MLGRRRWWEILLPLLSPYSDWNVRRRARKDASAATPIPAWNAEALPPFLRMLCQAGNQDLRALAKEWHNEDRRHKTAWALAGPTVEWTEKAAEKARQEVCLALSEYEKTHGHRLVDKPHRLRYGLLVALLCILEFPLNALVFRGFGETELFTWLLAFGFGMCLTLCAHHLGKFLREKRTAVRLSLSGLLVILPSAAIVGVAIMRANYLAAKTGDGSVWSPDVMIPFFIAWNLILYAVATIASYRHHDPFRAEVVAAQHELHKVEYSTERAAAVLEEARVRREKRFAEKQEHAMWIQEEVKRLGSVYWTLNLQVRTDMGDEHTTNFPKSYDHDLEIVIPEELKSLTWGKSPTHRPEEASNPQKAPDDGAELRVPQLSTVSKAGTGIAVVL